jgi:hypothetical protein
MRGFYKLFNSADVGRPSFERLKEVNQEYFFVATRRMCKTIRIFLLNMINQLVIFGLWVVQYLWKEKSETNELPP